MGVDFVDHGREGLHGARGLGLFGVGQLVPGAGAHGGYGGGVDAGGDEAETLEGGQAAVAEGLGAGAVGAAVFADDVLGGLQGPVWGGEGKVGEEGLLLVGGVSGREVG